MKKLLLTTTILCLLFSPNFIAHSQENALPARNMEHLNRGLVAVRSGTSNFLSWRLYGNDDPQTIFKIYRGNELVKTTTPTEPTNYTDTGGATTSVYSIEAYVGDKLIDKLENVSVWANQYKAIQLQRPPGGITPPNVTYGGTSTIDTVFYRSGQNYTFTPNDCAVADLDGDGEYEIIVKWDPSNSKDNSQTGITGPCILDAYKLDGTLLWRINLGINVRAGAHYTQFMVYDFDGCGRAEMICKTAPGSKDGLGNNIILGSDDPNADYRNLALNYGGNSRCGFVLRGPEYLTLFDGLTGENLHSIPFSPARGSVSDWGDSYGNRVDRFLACVAYLGYYRGDVRLPSAVMVRGYYNKAALTAYDVREKKLVQRWAYDSTQPASVNGGSIAGNGNHNLSVGDVDGSGKDCIILGSSAVKYDGKRLWNNGMGHGDAIHVGKLDPDRPGLQIFQITEDTSKPNHMMIDAATGAIIWQSANSGTDNGRGMAADVDSRNRGYQCWSSAETGLYNCKGTAIASASKPNSTNFRIYWDGDLQDELFDGQTNPVIRKWVPNNTNNTLLTMTGYRTCNGTKATPCISADILGDWREEVVVYQNSGNYDVLRIYTTITPTTHRLYTLMHDPHYRLSVAWQNTAYNQPPHLGFYLGDGVDKAPIPNIVTIPYDPNWVEINDYDERSNINTISTATINGKTATISHADGSITCKFPKGTVLGEMSVTFTLGDNKAKADFTSGSKHNFANGPLTITVTAENEKTKTYTVTVTAAEKLLVALLTASDIYTQGYNEASHTRFMQALEDYDVDHISAATPYSAALYNQYELIVVHPTVPGNDGHLMSLKALVGVKPILNLKSFCYQSGRWNWTSSNATNASSTNLTRINVSTAIQNHPAFENITFTGTGNNELALYTGTTLVAANAISSVPTLPFTGTAWSVSWNDKNHLMASFDGGKTQMHELNLNNAAKYILVAISTESAAFAALSNDAIKLLKNAAAYLINPNAYYDYTTNTFEINAQTPEIDIQPQGLTVKKNESAMLSISASVTDGGTLTYQWYISPTNSNIEGDIIEGATEAEYSPSTAETGTKWYYCIVTNTNNEATNKTATVTSNAVAVTVENAQNLQTPNAANSISIYPNPVKDKLKIENGQLKIENVEIFDISGIKIVNYQLSTVNSIDVSTLSQGIYFVKIETAEGIVMKKIVKE